MYLLGLDGRTATLLNSSEDPAVSDSSYTTNFLLQAVSEQRVEKFQPITTFGATYGFFFGEQPRTVTFNAILLNTADFQWEVEWWANYEESLRGTRAVDKQVRAYITYDDVLMEGYLTSASTQKNAQNSYEVPLTFTMWVTGVEYLVEPGDKHFPLSEAATTVNMTPLDEFVDEFGDVVSTTAEVRSRNIGILTQSPTGLFGKLRAGLDKVQDFIGRVGQTLSNVLALLYGRNLVIPAGFAGSERAAGQAVFASGSGFEQLQGLELGSGATLSFKLPVDVTKVPFVAVDTGVYFDNIDEYVQRAGDQDQQQDRTDAQIAAQRFAGDPREGKTSNDQLDALSTSAAEGAFAAFGIDINNLEGRRHSALARALGRATFAALNIAASETGASQAAASLTVGGTI
jgi:hypothetical protein